MPEFRKDPVTGRWVIIATERVQRPSAFIVNKEHREDGFCPFCSGNESHTPPETLAYRPEGSQPNAPDWWMRVIPNKYPALVEADEARRSGEGMYDRIDGMGVHEVVIETPDHDARIGALPLRQVEEIVWAYRNRSLEMSQRPHLSYVLIFKNHQSEAGASLQHPHSQLIAMPIVPKRVQEEMDDAQRYYDYKERCVFCDMIDQELRDTGRVLFENERFVAFLPYASRFPYECWILPRRHSPFFHEINEDEVTDFSRILRDTMARYEEALDDPPYNWIVHTTPFHQGETPHYHWHLEIIPKLTRPAGFEWGTGFYINPIAPEDAARTLRPASAQIERVG